MHDRSSLAPGLRAAETAQCTGVSRGSGGDPDARVAGRRACLQMSREGWVRWRFLLAPQRKTRLQRTVRLFHRRRCFGQCRREPAHRVRLSHPVSTNAPHERTTDCRAAPGRLAGAREKPYASTRTTRDARPYFPNAASAPLLSGRCRPSAARKFRAGRTGQGDGKTHTDDAPRRRSDRLEKASNQRIRTRRRVWSRCRSSGRSASSASACARSSSPATIELTRVRTI